MKILSINLGQERPLQVSSKPGKTGIYKLPGAGPAPVTPLGLPGDAICDVKHHGGPDQALYIYGAPDYAWWSQELGTPLAPGTFGDNLTIAGLESAAFSVGDRLTIGALVLEVTAPRIPCGTLAMRMGDPGFVKRFRFAERPGLYCRVIQPATIQVGDPVSVQPCPHETVTILEMFRDYYEPALDETTLHRYLAAPIAVRSRIEKEQQLRRLLAG